MDRFVRAGLRSLERAAGYFAPPGRSVRTRPDDVFVVSYPKSGNTWVRFLISQLDEAVPLSYSGLHGAVPDIYLASRRSLNRRDSPRVLKSHEPFDSRYRRIIHIVRDPRDVSVSYYKYLKGKRAKAHLEPEEFADRFLSGRLFPGCSWAEHAASWQAADPNSRESILIRFEDLRADTFREATRISEFLGRGTDPASIRRAVDRCSFENLRALERKGESAMAHRSNIPFFRSGASQQTSSELPKGLLEEIESGWAGVMDLFGYTPTLTPDARA